MTDKNKKAFFEYIGVDYSVLNNATAVRVYTRVTADHLMQFVWKLNRDYYNNGSRGRYGIIICPAHVSINYGLKEGSGYDEKYFMHNNYTSEEQSLEQAIEYIIEHGGLE